MNYFLGKLQRVGEPGREDTSRVYYVFKLNGELRSQNFGAILRL